MKREWLVKIFSIVLAVSLGVVSGAPIQKFSFFDDFSSYENGAETTIPIWIPQYAEKVFVKSENGEKFLQIDSYSEFGGDRDNHVALNSSIFPESVEELSLEWDFKVVDCNSTWKLTQGVTPQGSSGYVHYHDPDNFLDAEFKIFANEEICGDGLAQLSVFKRVNGLSTSLISYTTFNFEMNREYNAKIVLRKYNETNYNYSIYLDDEALASSFDVLYGDIQNGKILLENGGTITNFDNVYIDSLHSKRKCRGGPDGKTCFYLLK